MKTLIAAVVALAVLVGASAVQAGAVNGPQAGTDKFIGPNGTDTFYLAFNGGVVAQVGVAGRGSSDLDVFVYDQYGRLVASDTDCSDSCLATWMPLYTGTFTIRVVNRDAACNLYGIATN